MLEISHIRMHVYAINKVIMRQIQVLKIVQRIEKPESCIMKKDCWKKGYRIVVTTNNTVLKMASKGR